MWGDHEDGLTGGRQGVELRRGEEGEDEEMEGGSTRRMVFIGRNCNRC